MANTNDALRKALEAATGGEVFVEGIGQQLNPFRVVVTLEDGYSFEAKSTETFDEFVKRVASLVPPKKSK